MNVKGLAGECPVNGSFLLLYQVVLDQPNFPFGLARATWPL